MNNPGIFGTGASLLSDLSLIAYIALIVPAMVVGYYFARRGKHRPHHKYTMIAITTINWLLIVILMIGQYLLDVPDGLQRNAGDTRYLLPTIHGILGLPAQLLATYIIYRMLREDSQVAKAKARREQDIQHYWFKAAKPLMRLVLALWFLTAAFGVLTYLVRYEVLTPFNFGDSPAPIVTQEAPTIDNDPPLSTTQDTTPPTLEPAVTQDIAPPPATTQEP